ncbi:MAG: restriction endonuclease subunit S [Vescimonas sp.]
MKKYAVLTREPRCFLGSFDFSWEQRKLGDISEIKTGPFGSTLHADDYVSDGTPIITTEHFKTGALPRSKNGLPQVSDSDYKRLTAYTLDDGDIVFSRVGSVDINALITPFQSNWLFSGRVLRVRPQTDISSKFLHTRLETESIKTDIRTRAVGQTMPSINTEILKITPLVLPSSAAEQEQIGSYFAALDHLITLHQRKCVFLFSFFRACISMNFTASTFSWEQRKLSELTSMHARIGWQNLRTSEFLDSGDYMLITGTDFNDGAINFSTCHYVERERYEQDRNIQIHNGSILITKDGTLGKVAYVQGLSMPATLNAGVFNVQIKDANNVDERYLFQYLKAPFLMDYVDKKATGGTIKHLNQSILVDFPVILPQRSEQILIGAFFQQLDNLITLHQRECISFTGSAGRLILTANKKRTASSWEQRKVGDLLIERNQQAPMSDEYPLMAFIANEGVAPKGERYDRSALVTDTVNKLYKKTEKGDFIYSSNNLETGSIGLNKYGKACISPVYSIFEPTGIADSDFLGRRLVRKDFINAMVKWRQGVIYGQWRIHESDFLKIEITVPSVEEQRKIGTYLDKLDHLITLHQRKPFLMKWRTSDANRNQTNRLVL